MKTLLSVFLCLTIAFSAIGQAKPSKTKPATSQQKTKPKPKSSANQPVDEFTQDLQGNNGTAEVPTFQKTEPVHQYDYTTSDLAVRWHELIYDLVEQTVGYTPNVASRTFAYINLAAYEASVPSSPEYISLVGQIQGLDESYNIHPPANYNGAVATNAAYFKMVDNMFQSAPFIWMERVYALNDTISNQLKKIVAKEAFDESKAFGEDIAEWIYEYSKSDGGHMAYVRTYDMNYKISNCMSCFQINRVADLENTGPLHPNWGKNRPFLKINNDSIDVKPKVEFSHYNNSAFYKMAMEVYNVSKEVTVGSEKAQIANFWDDAATFSYTAPGHSISILSQVLKQNPTSIIRATELLSNLSMAVNDAFIHCWRLKYKYNLIRPITYIKRYIDSKWEPIILTPPFPEYPSGHSTQTSAMATVLTAKLGEKLRFIDYSKFFVGPEKTFNSFWEAARECSISRIYGGIHFRDGMLGGEELGKIIGKNALTLKYTK